MKTLEYIRTSIVVVAFLILLVCAFHPKAKADSPAQIVVVPGGNYDQVVLPSGEIRGFSCAAGIRDVEPNCYILIK